jgi:hypothetical protein
MQPWMWQWDVNSLSLGHLEQILPQLGFPNETALFQLFGVGEPLKASLPSTTIGDCATRCGFTSGNPWGRGSDRSLAGENSKRLVFFRIKCYWSLGGLAMGWNPKKINLVNSWGFPEDKE